MGMGRLTSSSMVVSAVVLPEAARLSWQNKNPMTRSRLFSMNIRSTRTGVAPTSSLVLVVSPAIGTTQLYPAFQRGRGSLWTPITDGWKDRLGNDLRAYPGVSPGAVRAFFEVRR